MPYPVYSRDEIDQIVGGVLTRLSVLELTAHAHDDQKPPPVTPVKAPTCPPFTAAQVRPGPSEPPTGAVTVNLNNNLAGMTQTHPPGTVFWLAPGVHALGGGEYDHVIPKGDNTYLGAPGAVLDGKGVNRYAFVQRAQNVTIKHLTIRGFVPPRNEGVVNHDSGDGWVIEHCVIRDNGGAAMMAGANQRVRYCALLDNGQYGINAYQAGDGITGLVIGYNEIAGNNTGDWEARIPGCGCTGGMKLWAVNGADIRGNWVHHNRSVGVWADTNNNDVLIEGNLIEDNDAEAIWYETSYNVIIRCNTLRRNTLRKGEEYAGRNDNFPVAAIYLSEAGGDSRVPARTGMIEVYGNVLTDNWSGITLWENADRFANSPANTSAGYCTLVVDDCSRCAVAAIDAEPYYSDCRWKTKNVNIHHNTFQHGAGASGWPLMAMLSNYGTYPDWSPYKARAVQEAITHQQNNLWRDNTYLGPWRFNPYETGKLVGWDAWKAAPYNQDAGSTYTT